MAQVSTYSKSKDGNKLIVPDFKVREMACNDGTDSIKIDYDLMLILQKVREWAGKPVNITSGYRTPTYNAKVGGASNSYHTKGQAADIVVTGKTSTQVAAFLETIGVKGIMDYTSQRFTHVDTRTSKYWATVGSKGTLSMNTFGGAAVAGPPAEREPEMTEAQVRTIAQEIATNAVNHAMETMQSILTDGNRQLPKWAEKEFSAAVEAGITDGSNPTAYATRYEVAIMVNRKDGNNG